MLYRYKLPRIVTTINKKAFRVYIKDLSKGMLKEAPKFPSPLKNYSKSPV